MLAREILQQTNMIRAYYGLKKYKDIRPSYDRLFWIASRTINEIGIKYETRMKQPYGVTLFQLFDEAYYKIP